MTSKITGVSKDFACAAGQKITALKSKQEKNKRITFLCIVIMIIINRTYALKKYFSGQLAKISYF
ncbi:hypothetical protein CO116_02280 [Candidatus Falkowbacteria bacterium CG_4_9_14_3_um_filter_38_19]|uniref:Uncharacterized protein n=2 Tax=Candidatus Falkowiibacteriota TaxID=1752728 RepID=A0A2M6WPG1_9BACT|nr:MAG: hypothetical protein COT96_02870 [Candidatus Falkowbacteria bacterium CG10_big_fil_rev_8_21_14_0_10_38_22]PJB16346.1 MAG: hypothetical protein CO116_02280 [Candidatus Falkowbacteria bacterium CG_4_9_14_3_um_filter_38_19]